jgi:hypothetical protein
MDINAKFLNGIIASNLEIRQPTWTPCFKCPKKYAASLLLVKPGGGQSVRGREAVACNDTDSEAISLL